MVGLARQDLVGPEELLEQHHARELVGQRELAEREAVLDVRQIEPVGAADHEAHVAPVHAPVLEPAREFLRIHLVAVAMQQRDVGALGDPALDGLGLLDLDELEPRVAGDQPLVVLHVIRERRLEPPDRHDEDPHGPILRARGAPRVMRINRGPC